MSSTTIIGKTGFTTDDLWIDNTGSSTNEGFAVRTSATGDPNLGERRETYREFTFDAGGLHYRYIGEWVLIGENNLLTGTVSSSGSYKEIVVEDADGNVIARSTLDKALAVDFGSETGLALLGIGDLLTTTIETLFPPGADAYANLHYDETPNLPEKSGASDMIRGSARADQLIGDEDANILSGAGGADDLQGGAGADTIRGGAGNDVAAGGAGNDNFSGGGGNDRFDGGEGADTARGGLGNDNLVGGAAADQLFGAAGDDSLFGGDGNDVLRGGNGADRLNGELNQDMLFGDIGDDILTGGNGADTLYGGGNNDRLSGDDGNDHLDGGAGADTLQGLEGNDLLAGGLGIDRLTGGAGADTFLFAAGGATQADIVTDFSTAEDRIALDDAAFAQLSPGILQAGLFTIGTAAGDPNDRVIYDDRTGVLYYDRDGTGAAAMVEIATLDRGLDLSSNDFLVV